MDDRSLYLRKGDEHGHLNAAVGMVFKSGGKACCKMHPKIAVVCTRNVGHSGVHVAWGASPIALWGEPSPEDFDLIQEAEWE